MDRSEFDQDHRIDPLQLDVEATQQPELFFKWAERAVEARATMDRAKLRLETIEALCALDVRNNPAAYGLAKTTEGGIKASVKTEPKYAQAHDAYVKARKDSALLDKAVMAMEMKKRMIETLITLHGQSYFAGPATPRNLGDMYQKQKAARSKNVTKRQKNKIRKRKKTK